MGDRETLRKNTSVHMRVCVNGVWVEYSGEKRCRTDLILVAT